MALFIDICGVMPKDVVTVLKPSNWPSVSLVVISFKQHIRKKSEPSRSNSSASVHPPLCRLGIQTPGSQPTDDHRDAQISGTSRVENSSNSAPPVLGFLLATLDDAAYPPVEEAYPLQDDILMDDFADMDDMMNESHSFGKSLCHNSVVVAIGSVALMIFFLYPIVLCFLVCFARKIARTYREEHEDVYSCSFEARLDFIE